MNRSKVETRERDTKTKMITPENIVRHELIGLECRVYDSNDEGLVGIEGKVVNETTRTLKIKTHEGVKQVPKAVCTFDFTLPDGRTVRVEGSAIEERPADRVKMKT